MKHIAEDAKKRKIAAHRIKTSHSVTAAYAPVVNVSLNLVISSDMPPETLKSRIRAVIEALFEVIRE